MKGYLNWIEEHNDSFSFYENIMHAINNYKKYGFENLSECYFHMSQAFSLIMGSRYLFLLFLKQVSFFEEVQKELSKIIKQAEVLKNLFYKAMLTKGINEQSILQKSMQLKKFEEKVYNILKA